MTNSRGVVTISLLGWSPFVTLEVTRDVVYLYLSYEVKYSSLRKGFRRSLFIIFRRGYEIRKFDPRFIYEESEFIDH